MALDIPRRRQALALAINLVCLLSNVWPLVLPAVRVEPLILGLPFALAWMLGSITVSFFTLLWLYRSEAEQGGS